MNFPKRVPIPADHLPGVRPGHVRPPDAIPCRSVTFTRLDMRQRSAQGRASSATDSVSPQFWRHGSALPQRPAALAGETEEDSISSGGITTFLVDRSAKRGLAERKECSSDRRALRGADEAGVEKPAASIFPEDALVHLERHEGIPGDLDQRAAGRRSRSSEPEAARLAAETRWPARSRWPGKRQVDRAIDMPFSIDDISNRQSLVAEGTCIHENESNRNTDHAKPAPHRRLSRADAQLHARVHRDLLGFTVAATRGGSGRSERIQALRLGDEAAERLRVHFVTFVERPQGAVDGSGAQQTMSPRKHAEAHEAEALFDGLAVVSGPMPRGYFTSLYFRDPRRRAGNRHGRAQARAWTN